MRVIPSHCFTLVVILIVVLLPAGVSDAAGNNPDPKVDFWLTILHNNDGESQVINAGSGLEDFGGAAPFMTVVDNLKWEATHGPWPRRGAKRGVMMISSGDNFIAGPEFNASLEAGVPFYDTIAMELIGYDAISFGNHDFDFGPDVLADFLDGYVVIPPYVAANLDFSGEPRLQAYVDAGVIVAAAVVKERGELVGVIGIVTPNLPFISSPRIQNDIDLAFQLEGVDVIIAGGGDELLANPGDLLLPGDDGDVYGTYPQVAIDAGGNEVPVVTTSGEYRYVGRLVVGFDKSGNVVAINEDRSGPVRVATGTCNGTLPCDDAVEPDPLMQTMVVDPVTAYLDGLASQVVGFSIHDLDGRRATVRSQEANEGNLIADALLWQATELAPAFGVTLPDVALQNGGGIRNNTIIPEGPITALDTFDMVPFPNFVTVLENISRDQFKEILENAVSRTQPGDTPGGTGRFAQISGFNYEWSGSGTAQVLSADGIVLVPGTRVQEVTLDDGTEIVNLGAVEPGPDLTVATIDFLAKGGDQYPFRGAPFTSLGATYQQALENYIVDALGGSISAPDYAFGVNERIFELP